MGFKPFTYTKLLDYGSADTQIRFPKFRSDGTFAVYVHLDSPGVASTDIESWLESWVASNREWELGWSDVFQTDRFYLCDSFIRSPHLVFSDNERLILRLDGKPGARNWRDWYARLVTSLIAHFPETQLVKVTDC